MSILNEDVKNTIQSLVSKIGTRDTEMYLSNILSSVSQMALLEVNGKPAIDKGDWKLLSRAMKEFRNSFRVFSKYKDTRKVCIFGSARTLPEDPDYILTEALAKQIVDDGMMVLTGAGGGIMEAGNKGAGEGNSFGMNIQLPFEQDPNPYILADPKLISYKYFFIRKLMFIKESDATVLLPGGFGTLDEAYEGLTLMQTGKSNPRPVVLLCHENSNYWDEWITFFKDLMLPLGYISPDDLDLFSICHSVEDATQVIKSFYKTYHSLRYVRDDAVIRLNHPLHQVHIDELNDHFKDIIVSGSIQAVEPYEEEKMTRDQLKKPRIAFHFNRLNFGRLVSLIHHINRFDTHTK